MLRKKDKKEEDMYILYRVDNDNGNITETPIGVVNGDEAKAYEWIDKNKHLIENAVKKEMYPYYKPKFIKELK